MFDCKCKAVEYIKHHKYEITYDGEEVIRYKDENGKEGFIIYMGKFSECNECIKGGES